MKKVFILEHSYEVDFCDETKFIGVYSTTEQATAAIERLRKQPGFRNRQANFCISEYELNKDHWTEGYASMITIEVEDKNGDWVLAEAELLIDGTYQIGEQPGIKLTGMFKSLDIVRCDKTGDRLRAVALVSRPS